MSVVCRSRVDRVTIDASVDVLIGAPYKIHDPNILPPSLLALDEGCRKQKQCDFGVKLCGNIKTLIVWVIVRNY